MSDIINKLAITKIYAINMYCRTNASLHTSANCTHFMTKN